MTLAKQTIVKLDQKPRYTHKTGLDQFMQVCVSAGKSLRANIEA
jgi:hypothetical protein